MSTVTLADVFLVALGAVAVGAGVGVVTAGTVAGAGRWLVVVLGAVAGLYVVLAAYTLVWVQLVVYVGTVVLALRLRLVRRENDDGGARSPLVGGLLGAGVGLGLAALLVDAYRWSTVSTASTVDATTGGFLGGAVVRSWTLPLELLGVLLLAAVAGAVALARRPA